MTTAPSAPMVRGSSDDAEPGARRSVGGSGCAVVELSHGTTEHYG
ncbi:hypothetical protein Ae168Ps1_1862 [Pseudonocardia sp. Ae168_Ps1]|nr:MULTISPECIES: hypothetical protein [unclassified Pseudonocardia]OLL73480.1 hypothetical protein Ae150APs1_1858 [Pseudonocardia sp. Ae150A_Ps1]OLL79456.1 hypothetical protein Ae168Ps1_1862 [Pseudonocardia sp. Ae168_Ps1]OLL86408.1 hypothetical protein Ae263Ps1_3463c [Pseudonocardia sp. Ae263_Ps1]OLL93550.1 hypothetical protein Ae356Ps1_3447 [Pseudonocardia sp. Ae356_Ps1]